MSENPRSFNAETTGGLMQIIRKFSHVEGHKTNI